MGAENLGVESLISVLKNSGHNVTLSFDPAFFADFNTVHYPVLYKLVSREDEVIRESLENKPDIIGFSSMTDNYKWNLRIAERIKAINPDIRILFGGIHPTLVPEFVIKEGAVDFLLMGEAEYSIQKLIANINNNEKLQQIEGLWSKTKNGEIIKGPDPEPIHNIDDLPFLDKELFYSTGFISKDIYRTMCSRGCPYNCSYCCYNYLHKLLGFNKIRQRGIESVISELLTAKRLYNYKTVHFNDDIFTFNKKWVLEFLSQYKTNIKKPFSIITHPKFIDEDIARSLKNAGCYRVQLGVQTLNPIIKRKYLKRFETNEDIERCFTILDRAKISYSADQIIGLPEEDTNELFDNAIFYTRFKRLKMVNVYWLSLYPKTEIIEYVTKAEEKDIINNKINSGETTYYLMGHKSDMYQDKISLKNAEIALLSSGSLPEYISKMLINALRKDIYFPYSLRYLFYLLSIISIPDYSWLSYIENYYKNIPKIMLSKIIKKIMAK